MLEHDISFKASGMRSKLIGTTGKGVTRTLENRLLFLALSRFESVLPLVELLS